MKATEITLDRYAEIYEELINRKEQRTDHELFFTGSHPEFGACILFQNGCSNNASLLQLDVAP